MVKTRLPSFEVDVVIPEFDFPVEWQTTNLSSLTTYRESWVHA
jgi:hypothetical protein